MEKPVRVRILDQEYLIRSDEDEGRVQAIAGYVNERFKRIRENAEGLSERKCAILLAFDIAGEYFQVLRERDHLVMDIQKRAKALNTHIDTLTG